MLSREMLLSKGQFLRWSKPRKDWLATNLQTCKDMILTLLCARNASTYHDKQALYVTTGGPVSSYFDAVIPIEDTEAAAAVVGDTHIKILKKMAVGQFIREPGSDIKSGQVVLEKMQVLKSAEIGLLATVGRVRGVKVYRKPIIGLLSTGNELVGASTEELEDGKIRDSNKIMLKSILKEH